MLDSITTLDELAATCLALGVDLSALSDDERVIIPKSTSIDADLSKIRDEILAGRDPLGDAFCDILSADHRRSKGQTFTPDIIVQAMLGWSQDRKPPHRIVDPGSGSGRYIVSALRAYPKAVGVAMDIDPYATLMTRAHAAVAGVADRLSVAVGDYRTLDLPDINGATLFIGNPPYVRHHHIDSAWKKWLVDESLKLGLSASKLAGLHAHFFLATALYARPGDLGAFITSSEWLDVNYGKLIRELLLDKLPVSSLHIIDPTTAPFKGTSVTGTITCFEVGSPSESVRIQNVTDLKDLGRLDKGFSLSRSRLAESTRWSVLTRVTPNIPEGYIELGELARVHRGAVTGANKTWVVRKNETSLPDDVLFTTVTRAHELFGAGVELTFNDIQKAVIDLPADLDQLDNEARELVDRFLAAAKKNGVDQGYVARNRQKWWRVGLKAPAPILATYMARRPPTFVRNSIEARHINIAHGIYPREELPAQVLDNLAEFLRTSVTITSGRTYAGGLTKFEPREMERLVVPSLNMLRERSWYAPSEAAPVE